MSRRRRLAMVNRGHPGLSVVKQCRLLQLSRSAVYYRPTPTNPADLDLMAGMDRQYLKTPYYGSRRMTAWLRTQGHQVNRKRVRRLMRAMGLEAIYRKPNTSKPAPEHRIYPYLLKGVAVEAYDLLRLAQGIKDKAESDLRNLADIDRCDSALGELDSLFVAAQDRLSPRQRPAQRAP